MFVFTVSLALVLVMTGTTIALEEDLIIYTVATDQTDGYKRLLRSAKVNHLDGAIKVLGMGEEWVGGDVARGTGGGQKVKLFRRALEDWKYDEQQIIMFIDAYDVVLLANQATIVDKFKSFNARVLFSAEESIWPNKDLKNSYPQVSVGKRYLNSGGIIGYGKDLYELLEQDIADDSDDQLYYTMSYLDASLREKLKMTLDHKSEIFQNLYAAEDDVEVKFDDEGNSYLQNTLYDTYPAVVHGNGLSKLLLNRLSNYLANSYNSITGCLACKENVLDVTLWKNDQSYPVVLLSLFIEHPTPFLPVFFTRISSLNYPKSRIHLYVHCNERYHGEHCKQFTSTYEKDYSSVRVVGFHEKVTETTARNNMMNMCKELSCDYVFSVDADAQLTNTNTLLSLMSLNRGLVSAMLVRPGKLWSSFWGDLNEDGFYARSDDYLNVVKREIMYVLSKYSKYKHI